MIHRNAFKLALLTFISRILGLARSILIANFLGTTFIADAFMIAFKIPNLLRRLVGEGSMTAAFIPVFSDVRKKAQGNIKEESVFLSRFYSLAGIILFCICVLGILFAPVIVRFLYFFGNQSPEVAIFLTRYMFSYIAFISLAAITQGVLNANLKFVAPALSPIILNIVIITSLFTVFKWIPDSLIISFLPKTRNLFTENPHLLKTAKAAFSLATGVIIGGILQFLIQLPSFFKLGYRLFMTADFHDKHLPKIGKLMIPGIFGLGIYQINALIADPFVLAFLEEGCIAALNYSNRLLEFSIGVFVISISTVILPNLSMHVSDGKMDKYADMVVKSVKLIIFISIPASFGLIFLRVPLIDLLFKSGLFSSRSQHLVSSALFYHALGLMMISIYRIYSPAFFALKDTKTPVWGAFISLIINLIGCATLPRFMGIGGIALASTLAASGNAAYLIIKLQKRIPALQFKLFYKVLLLSFLSALVMGIVLYGTKVSLIHLVQGKILLLCFIFSSVILGAGAYFVSAFLLKMEEALYIVKHIRSKMV